MIKKAILSPWYVMVKTSVHLMLLWVSKKFPRHLWVVWSVKTASLGEFSLPIGKLHSIPLILLHFYPCRSILESEKEHLTLLLFPPEDDKNACVVIEVGYLSRTCPNNLCKSNSFSSFRAFNCFLLQLSCIYLQGNSLIQRMT